VPTVIVGNKREIPGDIPITFWWEKILEYEALPDLAQIPWTHPVMEYLPPEELNRIRAKALIWREVTGEWPRDVAVWWEVRLARRRGDLPPSYLVSISTIDEEGTLHCGNCKARWSAAYDGTPHNPRCKLCGVLMWVFEDIREEWDYDAYERDQRVAPLPVPAL